MVQLPQQRPPAAKGPPLIALQPLTIRINPGSMATLSQRTSRMVVALPGHGSVKVVQIAGVSLATLRPALPDQGSNRSNHAKSCQPSACINFGNCTKGNLQHKRPSLKQIEIQAPARS